MTPPSRFITSRRLVISLASIVVIAYTLNIIIVDIFPRFELFQTQYQLSELNRSKNIKKIDSLLEELHVSSLAQQQANIVNDELQARIDILASEQAPETYEILQTIKTEYEQFLKDRKRNESVGLSVPSIDGKKLLWGDYLLTSKFAETKTDIESTSHDLSVSYGEYIASLPTPTPKPPVVTTPTTG
ncbi:hypothetical protein GW793_01685 [bacterium]|uniref:Uncharacterized protein n=1 Tax=candidate division WWE3 bacterium CG_4_9_14_3_um_filter_39_7 TaxID=1975080 RepID=A0A2M7X1L9_UNCKA|nr:hypothetical protein [bacterium]PJA40076.1 MAG: hypothetical protein CO179_03545 [candidate division WWE3 bacterium CG_4_9_14_3_um_filter_39_7]